MAKKTIIYAFVLEIKKSFLGKLASDQDLDKIRQEVGAPDAEVKVIASAEWKPPKISSTSDQALNGKMMDFLFRVQDWFIIYAPHEGMTDTLTGGTIIRPKDGKKAFFAFKVEKDG